MTTRTLVVDGALARHMMRMRAWLTKVVDDIIQGIYDGWDAIWLGRWP